MALVHFQAAADRGYTTSQLIVAHFYAYGLTGPAKIDLALRYAKLALLQEAENASEKVAEYEELLANQLSGNLQSSAGKSYDSVPSPANPSISEPPPFLPPDPSVISFKPTANRLPSVYENTKASEQPLLPTPPTLPASSFSTSPSRQTFTPLGRKTGNSNNDLEMAKKHYYGRGANLDLSRAYELFYQSANRGNPESARYLGIMHLRGKGVGKDTQKALEWFSRAAQGGDEIAKKNLKSLQIINSRN
jgi:TPR repeat protein